MVQQVTQHQKNKFGVLSSKKKCISCLLYHGLGACPTTTIVWLAVGLSLWVLRRVLAYFFTSWLWIKLTPFHYQQIPIVDCILASPISLSLCNEEHKSSWVDSPHRKIVFVALFAEKNQYELDSIYLTSGLVWCRPTWLWMPCTICQSKFVQNVLYLFSVVCSCYLSVTRWI